MGSKTALLTPKRYESTPSFSCGVPPGLNLHLLSNLVPRAFPLETGTGRSQSQFQREKPWNEVAVQPVSKARDDSFLVSFG